MKAYVYLENGVFLEAKAFGKGGSVFGEMIFDKSFTGYQEIITDSKFKDKFIVFTSPEVGATGINDEDSRSDKIEAGAIFIRSFNQTPSNFRAKKGFEEFFKEQGKLAIYDIDTRFLTKIICEKGSVKAVVSTDISDPKELKKLLADKI